MELAEGGRGRVSPNPLVGAVIATDDKVVGEGFHAQLGDLHAERAALEDCRRRGEGPAGATMFVTLEPCAHQGRQPPCSEAILEAGIARVVIASDDPSEKAAGRGPGILRDGGVEVEFAAGEEATAARLLNQPFRKHARSGLPLVTLKMAMSMDGRFVTPPGDPRWISGERSRALVHRWRAEHDAIAVGIGTVLADDPLLTARDPSAAHQPTRVVFDSQARLPLDSHLLSTLDQSPVIVITSPESDSTALREVGAEVIVAEGIRPALANLGARNITSLFLEGGPTLAAAFTEAGEIDQARTFVAPILLGEDESRAGGAGRGPRTDTPPRPQAPSPRQDPRAERLAPLHSHAEAIGDDILITARFREW